VQKGGQGQPESQLVRKVNQSYLIGQSQKASTRRAGADYEQIMAAITKELV